LSQFVKISHRLPNLLSSLSFPIRPSHALPNANGNEIWATYTYVHTVSTILHEICGNTMQTDVDTEEGEALGTSCRIEW
jgi:hypothetical protein